METTIPVSIKIVGHPLIQTVTVAWSANAGMVPQSLLFHSEGGSAEAQLTSEYPAVAVIHCRVQVDFAIPGWEIVQFETSLPVNAGGDRIVIDPGSWIQSLSLELQITDGDDEGDASTQADLSIEKASGNHLVINVVWQTTRFSHPVKGSQRLRSDQVWDIPYLCISPQDRVSATISAFGVIHRQLVRMKPRSLVLAAAPLTPTQLLLKASSGDIQLLSSTAE